MNIGDCPTKKICRVGVEFKNDSILSERLGPWAKTFYAAIYLIVFSKNTVVNKLMFYLTILPMTEFELRTPSVGSNCSANWATIYLNFGLSWAGALV